MGGHGTGGLFAGKTGLGVSAAVEKDGKQHEIEEGRHDEDAATLRERALAPATAKEGRAGAEGCG